MTTLYLAGPMSGIVDADGVPNLNFPLFNAEAARLRALGYTVVNPAEINGGAAELVACAAMTPAELKAHWRKCMRRDIPAMMECDAIALLPNWFKSKGAKLEVRIGSDLDMPINMAADLVDRVWDFSDLDYEEVA
ncbi:DUF4406 domain-containing protein [Duganella violaceipulchra]|uniref:DUF4406 domain-containing protein n=1 Tax=Duganella violaceipulchra TaxID=2849652 RepID=A0AA41HBP7_9BURK|nr:DUF4406 domain-containing protein [Duganella violaceicalia]MBV6321932.1 DUF4406 domain-containing protein [Duganella violaceicalia]MCP2007074.1 hypothetical protein [Duganella violaceicalia]